MIVLALDSAGSQCGVAVLDAGDDRALAAVRREMRRGQAEALVPMVLDTLTVAGLAPAAVGLIGVTVGPGAFTGLRIGLAAAGGLGLGLGCGIVGVGSFAAVARTACPTGATGGPDLWVLLDSRRGDVFAQRFAADLTPLGGPEVLAPDALAGRLGDRPALLAGDGVATVAAVLPATVRDLGIAAPDPLAIARLAFAHRATAQADPPAPLYLRPPDASLAPPLRAIAPD